MKTIYLKTVDQLKTITALKWIDADLGQLDFYETKPPVTYPCALIDVELPSTEDLTGNMQDCQVRVTIRFAFLPEGSANSNAPTAYQTQALAFWDTVAEGYSALQGFSDSDVSQFTRVSQTTEKRDDNLKVVRQVWLTNFVETA